LVVANSVDAEVTCVFNSFPYKFQLNEIEKQQVLELISLGRFAICFIFYLFIFLFFIFIFAKSSHWDIVWCALVARSSSRS